MAIDDEQQILHWRGGAWHQIAWSDWLRFRGLTKPFAALPGVGEGVHHFVICTTEDGRFLNAVPHCYRVDQDGRIADDGNGGLSDIEIGSYQTLMMQRTLTGEEQAELDALRERLWRAHLPPAQAARELTRAAVALPDENDSAWELLEACGLRRG